MTRNVHMAQSDRCRQKVQQTAEDDVDDEKMSSVGISSFPLNFHLV